MHRVLRCRWARVIRGRGHRPAQSASVVQDWPEVQRACYGARRTRCAARRPLPRAHSCAAPTPAPRVHETRPECPQRGHPGRVSCTYASRAQRRPAPPRGCGPALEASRVSAR
ncbi:hypothetical protein EBM89_01565 [Cellulomonas triticagri]|uniref:Uncharacterized protein n=1 Tax=Cellulomonas triticagri TaxID=2483352 RepID=A0A3M2JVU2_9CELL|nr:hypothetical protein EBM89_01565 [Cellulomonas triticagri]